MQWHGALAAGFLVMVLAGAPVTASWEIFGLQVAAGTVLGYVGGYVGAQVASLAVQALGIGLVNGVLAPILAAYVGYAVGATLGAWAGVTWTGWHFRLLSDPVPSLLGASLGTGLAFLLASVTDWEWAFYLAPPLASLGSALLFSSFQFRERCQTYRGLPFNGLRFWRGKLPWGRADKRSPLWRVCQKLGTGLI